MVSHYTFPWGKGEQNLNLHPYSDVFTNDYSVGDTIFVSELENAILPGTFNEVHNGCLRVVGKADQYGTNHIDIFVGRLDYYDVLDSELGVDNANADLKACEVKRYRVPRLSNLLEATQNETEELY